MIFPVSRIKKTAAAALLLLGFTLVLSGCIHESKPIEPMARPCIPPAGVNLEQAMNQARSDLVFMECQMQFDAYFQRLLDIGTGDPKQENNRLFSEFLQWANQAGLINRLQAKNRYNRYFNSTFMSLPDEYNTCSICGKKDRVYTDMAMELRQKEKGMRDICRDMTAYNQTVNLYTNIQTVLEATCTACDAR